MTEEKEKEEKEEKEILVSNIGCVDTTVKVTETMNQSVQTLVGPSSIIDTAAPSDVLQAGWEISIDLSLSEGKMAWLKSSPVTIINVLFLHNSSWHYLE